MTKTANTSLKRKHASDNEEGSDMEWSDEEGGTRVEGIYIPPPATPLAAPNTATRLIITKITNNFFKSYADETIVGPFHKCFNAIVGPNGSGKSNVIDSMLFVFGYRATKIRSKKISVLLHNSDQYRNVQSCTVSVHFCQIIDKPGDDYEVVPGSEFVVSRTANKDNSSYYHLDDKKVPFKEVAQLLRKHGIDLDHNRFLILQGEVEEIAMMKCKGSAEGETGMLEYLEDIIGTTRYKKPLSELNDLMEILGEQRSEKLNRLRLVEKDLTELKPALEEAVEFLKTENIVVQCQNVLYQKNIHDLTSQAVDLEKEKSLVTEKHEKMVTQLKELAAEKSEKDKLLKNEASVYENLQKRKEKNKETFNNAEKKDVQLQADMAQLNNNRKKWKEDLAKERKRLAELERIPEENEKTIAECEGREGELVAKVKTLEEDKIKVLATLREETQELQEEKEELQIELTELKTTVNSTKSTFDMAESELKIFLSNEENEQKHLETIRANHAECTENITKRTEEVALLKKKIPLTEKSLREATEELNTVKHEESQIIRDLGSQRVVLEEKRSTMNASKSRGRVIDSLMQQKRQGNCLGLLGRLGDLGAINQKYDVAVSTACGPLDHIVVDTVDTAQWCIEYLKHNNIGRGSFIALDKQEHLRARADEKIRTPENVHRLYDLIQVENEAVKPAFYFGLRDTLVADDLDQATRIAYGQQRFRVVTLKGDLIETSGTMSGGGRSVLRGRMGQSVTVKEVNPKEIEKMEQSLQELENSVRVLRQKQVTLEDQVRTLHPELRQMKIDYEKFSKELDHLHKQQPLLSKELKEQEVKAKGTKADPAKVAKLQATITKNKASYDKALKAANEVQVKVDKLTAEIKAKQSGKMKGVEKSLSETRKTLEKCKSEITRLRVAIKTSERDRKKCTQKIQTLENDIESAENQLRTMKAEREQIEEDTKKLLECIQEITEQLLNGQDAYASRKEEVAELTKQENKLKLEKVDVDNALKNAKKKLDDCNGEMHQWHAKLKHLKLQDIPNEAAEELQQFTPEELEEKNIKAVERDLKTAMENIKTAKPNLNVIQEYRRGEAVFMQRSEELNQVTTRRNQIKAIHDRVKNQRKDEFMIGYNIIKLKLKEMYQMITLGGDADFEIVDSFDPFSEGVQLNVRPPKKSWKNISNLSGGEKTLSSLALVFALHHYKPSPLYVMDEIDAALDFKNVSIVAHYIKERTKNAQFIIISLRENMFQLCDRLVGIYKIFNCTHTIPVDPRKYEKQIEAASRVGTVGNEEIANNFDSLLS